MPATRRRLRRASVGLLAVPLTLGVAPAPVTAETPEPPPHAPTVSMVTMGCGFLAFRSRRARVWTDHVHGLTDVSCREARWVWRRRPAWRDEMP